MIQIRQKQSITVRDREREIWREFVQILFILCHLGRILTDVPCKVCHDNSSGKHYGIFACDG